MLKPIMRTFEKLGEDSRTYPGYKYIKIVRNLAKIIKEKDEKELILADLITIT